MAMMKSARPLSIETPGPLTFRGPLSLNGTRDDLSPLNDAAAVEAAEEEAAVAIAVAIVAGTVDGVVAVDGVEVVGV